MPIAAFVIDCDGTLVETEHLWELAERDTLERWGGTWHETIGASLAGNPLGTSARQIASTVERPAAHESVAKDLLRTFRERLHAVQVQAREGARELLVELAVRQIPVAVASNGTRVDVEMALRSAGLRPLIGAVHCPDVNCRPKPEPDLYLAACLDLGASPSSSIAIEDAIPGVQAARSAGLLTLVLAAADKTKPKTDYDLSALWPLDLHDLELRLGG